MKSIQARLGLGLGVTIAILFILQWLVVNYTIRHVTDEIFQTRLQHDTDSLLAALVVLESGKITLPFASVSDVYHRPFSGHYFKIDSPVNAIRSRSLWDTDLNVEHFNMKMGKVYFHNLIGPLDQSLLIYGIKIKKRGNVINVHVAHDITDLERDMLELRISYATISLLALIILLFLQNATIKRGLEPVRHAQTQLIAMQRGEIRLLDENAPTEVKPMVHEINRLVNLLSQRIERSRNALGNLAHALKSPLTVINNLAETAELKQHATLNATMRQQTKYMQQLIERELKRARLAGVSEPGKHFNLRKDIDQLVTMLESIYRSKDLALDINVPTEKKCPLDREDMMELVGNLLDNACKNAKRMVRFTAILNDQFIVRVEDDGPGVAAEKIDELLERGVRIDESTLGHGLGLAIVKDAITHYKGRLEMGRSKDLGGFSVTFALPLAYAID